MLGRKKEIVGKSPLGEDVNASALEVGVKPFVGLPVFHIETVDVVVVKFERTAVPSGLDNTERPVLNRLVQQAVADKIDQSVGRDPVPVFRKLFGKRLDEGYDIV